MIPVFSKVVLSSCILLITLVFALQFNGCESSIFSKTTVEMTNKLSNNLQLGLHCKDKNHDLGAQSLQPGQKWSFRFRPNIWADVTLYFCHFAWEGGDHWFDIYDESRDEKLGHFDSWDILETGPCRDRWDTGSRQCFFWKNVTAWDQLFDRNTTIGL